MAKIAVFDSGVGGITVLEEIYRLLPNENFIYFGDSLNAPYGDKTNDQIRLYASNIIDFLLEHDVKILVIACNTVTSFLYKELVNSLSIPVVGVIFPTVEYVNNLNVSKVGVVATTRTIENNIYQKLIRTNVSSLATPQFVPMIENGTYKEKKYEIKEILRPLIDYNVHVLVLGCTHYPFLKNIIESFYGGIIVDSGLVTAIEVKKYLEHNSLLENNAKVTIFVSGDTASFDDIISDFVTFSYEIVHKEVWRWRLF